MSTKLARTGKKTGAKAPNRYRDGKRIDRLNVQVEDGVYCQVDVYLRSIEGFEQALTAWCEEHQVEVTTTELNSVRTLITEKIRERLVYTWEPWLVVSVEERCNREGEAVEWDPDGGGLSLDLSVRVDCYEFGLAKDGRKCHRSATWKARPPGVGKWSREHAFAAGWIEPSSRKVSSENYGRGEGRSYRVQAVVRDTPEARAALEAVRLGMHRLGAQLSALLSQGGIESLLQIATLATPLALPERTEP